MIGTTLSHYHIIELLGKGGMGEVYRARDTKLDRDIALKILLSQVAADPERKARFAREARAVAALNHPCIVTIHSVEEDAGTPFLTMELVRGSDLSHHIPEGGMPVGRLLGLAIQIAEALAAANDVGITHRDLKPGNVMVTPTDQVKLLDFGLAKFGRGADADVMAALTDALTVDGTILGTIAYMSPEQLDGKPADHRSDLFALGIMLYQMATGSKPFNGPTQAAIMTAILRDEPKPVSELRPELPARLDGVIQGCLRKQPGERYQTARDLKSDLQAIVDDPGSSSGPGAARGPLAGRSDPGTAGGPPAIAVLPFTDLSQHGDQEYFCDGMTEEIINALTGVDGIRVAARTSSFQYKGRDSDVRAIGRSLNVDLVLEGSVRTAGDRLRVTAQLIKVADGYHLWSERYSRTMEDVFEIQDEIAASIASALETTIGAAAAKPAARHSGNVDAYHYYLRGRHCWNRRHQGVLPKALEYFRQAIDADPEYALAYSGLADCYNVLGFYGFDRPESAFRRSIAAATKALEIHSDHAEAHASLAYAQHHLNWNFQAAVAGYRHAIELKPGYAVAHQWYALAHVCVGRPDEAKREILRARELDPLSPVISTAVGWVHYLSGDIDRAVTELNAALELEPGFAWVSFVLGHANLQAGNLPKSIQSFRKAADATDRAPFYLAGLGHALAASGNETAGREILNELLERSTREYVSAEYVASIHAALGDRNEMFDWLRRAVDSRASGVIYAHVDPQFAMAHGDPRFDDLRQAMANMVLS